MGIWRNYITKFCSCVFVAYTKTLDGQGLRLTTHSSDAGGQEGLHYSCCPHENNSIKCRHTWQNGPQSRLVKYCSEQTHPKRHRKNEWATVIENGNGETNISHRLTEIFHPPPIADCTKSLAKNGFTTFSHRGNIDWIFCDDLQHVERSSAALFLRKKKKKDNDRNCDFKVLNSVKGDCTLSERTRVEGHKENKPLRLKVEGACYCTANTHFRFPYCLTTSLSALHGLCHKASKKRRLPLSKKRRKQGTV